MNKELIQKLIEKWKKELEYCNGPHYSTEEYDHAMTRELVIDDILDDLKELLDEHD